MNAAMLFFARALDRGRELDVRIALGAGSGRVIRLLLSEATVLAIAGGLVGVLIAYGSIAVFLYAAIEADLEAPPRCIWGRRSAVSAGDDALAFAVRTRYHLPSLTAYAIKDGAERAYGDNNVMANLSIRKLDEDTMRQLRVLAAKHGVSTEEQVRRILRRAVAGPERLGDLAVATFGPAHGVELELAEHTAHEPVDIER